MKTGIIPKYWTYGKLCLISKESNNAFPYLRNTRPIIILSPLYKLLELYWLYFTENIIWFHIDKAQIGFRKNCCTHHNIAFVKKMDKIKKNGFSSLFRYFTSLGPCQQV